jgi:hypothetical protein
MKFIINLKGVRMDIIDLIEKEKLISIFVERNVKLIGRINHIQFEIIEQLLFIKIQAKNVVKIVEQMCVQKKHLNVMTEYGIA